MTKILQALILVVITCSGSFFSCSTNQKTLTPQIIPKEEILKPAPADNPYVPWTKAQLLMGEGDSWNAQYSPDGKSVRVTSSTRIQHGQAEIYEIDLESSEVVRLTYQSGSAEEPHFFAVGPGLLYRSTTDEIKERPTLFEAFEAQPDLDLELPFLGQFGAYELYYRAQKSSDPVRLTRHPGFDGFASLSPDGASYIYSSAEAGQLDLKKGELAKPGQNTSLRAGPYHDAFPLHSPDGKRLLWIEIQTTPLKSRFYLGDLEAKNPELLAEFDGLAVFPDWHPHNGSVYFSGRADSESPFQVYALDTGKKCLAPVLSSKAGLTYPSLSPDGKKLLFTAEFEDKRQVYQLPVESEAVKCPEN